MKAICAFRISFNLSMTFEYLSFLTSLNFMGELIDLKIRKTTDSASEYNSSLQLLRSHIDVIDHKLLELMGKRMKTAEEIGKLKKSHNVAVLQSKRWNEILGKMILEGKQEDLSEEFIINLFKAIHQESIQHQKTIFNK